MITTREQVLEYGLSFTDTYQDAPFPDTYQDAPFPDTYQDAPFHDDNG